MKLEVFSYSGTGVIFSSFLKSSFIAVHYTNTFYYEDDSNDSQIRLKVMK